MYFLRLSSSIVSGLWKRIALLNDHRKYSHFASKIYSKRGSVGRLVGRQIPTPWFSSVSTVLFRIKKSHYVARYICSRNLLSFALRVYSTLLISSRRPCDISYKWDFSLSPIFMCMDFSILILSNIRDFYRLADPGF